ncbi:MAG: hypothetical protein IKQ92_05400 [Clostridia bacterium]|nr:hypothetical protein [Clostridia bacterium]
MDIKAKIEELVKKITGDAALKSQFTKSPVSTVEKLIGVDLPDDQVNKIVDGVKAKITVDKVSDAAGALKGLFGK